MPMPAPAIPAVTYPMVPPAAAPTKAPAASRKMGNTYTKLSSVYCAYIILVESHISIVSYSTKAKIDPKEY
jgi:hypothetical protein